MIYNPYPENWKELQENVALILSEVGMQAEIEKSYITPRGQVSIDVFAIDVNSIDSIKYIIECKNWNKKIPQSVVHSFTTVMNETGGNIGYIICNKGFQKGAISFMLNTNITGLTFQMFQEKYLYVWLKNYFRSNISSRCDDFIQYAEPYNSRRDRLLLKLNKKKSKSFFLLSNKYTQYGQFLSLIAFSNRHFDLLSISNYNILDISNFKTHLENVSHKKFKSIYYKDLLVELIAHVESLTDKFNSLFGHNIFQD